MANWIAYGILFAGLIICLFLIIWIPRRNNRLKNQNIQEYEDARNKLTFRKKKEPEPEEDDEDYDVSSGGGFSLGNFSIANLIGGFVAILIGVMLIGPISEQVKLATATQNVTSPTIEATTKMLSMMPAIFIGMVVITAIIIFFRLWPRSYEGV
jgi:hypothetical protein